MRLERIAGLIDVTGRANYRNIYIKGLAYDSRNVFPGCLFFAVKGQNLDGHDFVEEAVSRGAVAVVAERKVVLPKDVPLLLVPSSRLALASASSVFFGEPSKKLKVVGVTGTNGKTTTTFLIRSILNEAGVPAGLIGTVYYCVGGREIPAVRTTPESLDIQALFAGMVEEGLVAAVVEASSHALEQGRLRGIDFCAAVFTNLSPEHLDYHGDMTSYKSAKGKLFSALPPEARAIINIDDQAGREFARETPARVATYALDERGNFSASIQKMGLGETSFVLGFPGGSIEIETPLVGLHNVYNILAAFATSNLVFEIEPECIARGIRNLKGVPGRLERIECGQDFPVLVDYAHTDDALRRVLVSLRPLVKGRLIVVFGCGGDRDRSKRPRMGRVAEEFADLIWLTNDNPRSEEPAAIIQEIERGIKERGKVTVESDRARAIHQALSSARRGDLVLITGKGHESVQIFRDSVVPFDDRIVAREGLRDLGWGL